MGQTKSFIVALAVGAPVLFGAAAKADAAFVLFDNFDGYANAGLSGQGPAGNTWTAQAGATVIDTGGGDRVASVANNSIPNYRLLPTGLQVPNASAASTVFFNFSMSVATTGNNWNFVVTDVPTPADTAGTSEVQFNYDATQAPAGGSTSFRVRNGAAFQFLTTDGTAANVLIPQANAQYNVWLVMNNSADTYRVYMQSPGDPRIATPTRMFSDAGAGDFGFRNGAATNDLTTVNVGNGSTTSVVQFDDIYVDTAGQNLVNPVAAVPEPTGISAMGLAAAGLLARRRHRRA